MAKSNCVFLFWLIFDDLQAATGHGSFFVTNAFLSSSLIYLASQEVGCVDEQGVILDCEERVHGFAPSSLVTNIATIAALLAAFCLPVVGAIIDYTTHRKRIGQCSAGALVLVQAVLTGTGPTTWFIMSIVQACGAALYQIHFAIASAYLPDIARYDVNEETFNTFNRTFFSLQFGGEGFLLIFTVAIAMSLGLDTVKTAQLGQAFGTVWLVIAFGGAWRRFPDMPRRRTLPPGHNIFFEGFRQNWRTANAVAKQSSTLKWFFLVVVFAEAGSSAVLPIVLTLLTNIFKYDGTQVGISFLIALIATLPGIASNTIITRLFCPKRSAILAMVGAVTVTTAAIVHIPSMSQDLYPYMGKAYCCLWGFFLGWWYASEQLLFSFLVPAGQESELTGFFVCCTVFLTWLPPLIYSVIVNQGNINEVYGLSTLIAFQLLALLALSQLPSWEEALKSSKLPLVLSTSTDPDDYEKALQKDVQPEGTLNNLYVEQ